jgi:hypothetical protein
VWASSNDWTTAAPTQALFVVLTVIAVPWFIARLLRRWRGMGSGGDRTRSGQTGMSIAGVFRKSRADLHGLFMRRRRYLPCAGLDHGGGGCDGEASHQNVRDGSGQ